MKDTARKTKILESINVDEIAIDRDHYFSNAYIIDLPLDSTPDHAWQDIFEREWKSSRHLWDRKLFVVGDKLRLATTVDNIEDKLDWVKQVIERTNKLIDEYNRDMESRKPQKEEKRKRARVDQKANVDVIREVLRKRIWTG